MTRSISIVLAAVGLLAGLGAGAGAQVAELQRMPTDATIRIVNGTTGEPARAERVVLREPDPTFVDVAEAFAVDGEVTFDGLMLLNFRRHVATAWVDGVPYHAEQKGQDFRDGKPLVIHCFSSTDDPAGAVISGLNLVVRRQLDGLSLEYILQVRNESRPQQTIAAAALPVRIALPDGLRQLQVEVGGGGPDPRPAALSPADRGRQGIATALTPGINRITVRGLLPSAARTELTVAANLAVEAWSVLVWPAELPVESFDLERDRQNPYPDFARWLGEPLDAGRQARVTIGEVPQVAATAEPDTAGRPAQPGEPAGSGRPGFPWRTVTAAIVLGALYLFWRSRR